MYKKIVPTLLLFNIFFSYSQINTIKYNPVNKDSLIVYINSISDKKIIQLGGKNKKEIKNIVNERKTDFVKSINDSSYIFDNNISKYLKTILNEIYQANPNINNKDFYFLVNKSPIPNASCYGNGVFSINLGLFNIIESEDELAFIIAHEIAHFQLEHTDKSLIKYIETVKSKETKSKISNIRRQEFGRTKAYSDLMKNLSYNFLKRSRKAETQADSLGLFLFSRTKYNKNASVSSLKKLEFIDEIVFNEDTKVKSHLNFDDYPFKDNWLNKEEILFDIKEKVDDYAMNKDSLKTHPDIPLRIDLIQKLITNSNNNLNTDTAELNKIKKIAAENSISIFLNDSSVDMALYQTLIMYNKNQIDQKDYCNILAAILMKTYKIKNNHTFGKYVSPINSFSEEKYLNEIRIFLHNLELKNVRKIGFNFCKKYKSFMQNDIEFSKVENFFNTLNLN